MQGCGWTTSWRFNHASELINPTDVGQQNWCDNTFHTAKKFRVVFNTYLGIYPWDLMTQNILLFILSPWLPPWCSWNSCFSIFWGSTVGAMQFVQSVGFSVKSTHSASQFRRVPCFQASLLASYLFRCYCCIRLLLFIVSYPVIDLGHWFRLISWFETWPGRKPCYVVKALNRYDVQFVTALGPFDGTLWKNVHGNRRSRWQDTNSGEVKW